MMRRSEQEPCLLEPPRRSRSFLLLATVMLPWCMPVCCLPQRRDRVPPVRASQKHGTPSQGRAWRWGGGVGTRLSERSGEP